MFDDPYNQPENLWSDDLTIHRDDSGYWVIAFDFDGCTDYVGANPESDFFVPVADYYDTTEAANAALAVIKLWESPVARGGKCLSFEELRATPEWVAFVPHLPNSFVGQYDQGLFEDAADYGLTGGNPGAFEHYEAMLGAGVQVHP
jgi:hypothetical protein